MMNKVFFLACPVALARLLPLQSDFLEGIFLVFRIAGALGIIHYAITKKVTLSRFCKNKGNSPAARKIDA